MFYVLAAIVIAFLGLLTFLIVKLLAAKDKLLPSERRGDVAEVALDRAKYELGKATTALAEKTKLVADLEAYALEIKSGNGDLSADDIGSRMLRLLTPAAAETAGDPIPAEPVGEVRDPPGAAKLSESGDAALLRP